MSWNNLNAAELQACRKLLMIDVSEAAKLIGKCSARAWQRWEDGTRSVPGDVDSEIYALIQQRNDLVADLTEQQIKSEESDKVLSMKYYHSFNEWLADFPDENKVSWRIHQAAVAFVFSEGGDVELI